MGYYYYYYHYYYYYYYYYYYFFFLKYSIYILSLRLQSNLHLAAVSNNYFSRSLPRLRPKSLHLLHHIHALHHLSGHNVLPIQPLGLRGAEEELRAVGVRPCIGHRQNPGSSVLQCKVLILELVSVDRLASGSISSGEVAPLAHEVGDDAMEGRPSEPEPLLLGAQGSEILARLGHHVRPQLHDYLSEGRSVCGDVPM